MLWSLPLLFLCLAAGQVLHAAFGIPIPGTVIGILILLLGLYAVGRRGRPIALPAADGLLAYFGLFFVPPGVGAAMRVESLAASWPAIVIGILGSSVITLVVTGRVTQTLLAWQDRRAGEPKQFQLGRLL